MAVSYTHLPDNHPVLSRQKKFLYNLPGLPAFCLSNNIRSTCLLYTSRKSADWLSSRLHLTATVQVAHPTPCKIRDIESLHPLKYMAKGVYIYVSKPFRIRHCANSQRVQDYHKNSVIFLHGVIPPFSGP